MKKVRYIIYSLIATVFFVSCNSENDSIPAINIQSIETISHPGSIELKWSFENEEDINRFIEIKYMDPSSKESILKTISGDRESFTIENTLKKNGEYTFHLQPFSRTFTGGVVSSITGTSLPAPATSYYTSTEIALPLENISISGNQPDGSIIDPPTVDGNHIKNVLDADLQTRVNPNYILAQKGAVFYIDIEYPEAQDYLQFSYNTPTAGSVPSKIECYVKAKISDEWILLTELNMNDDNLPSTKDGALFKSKEYKASTSFKHFRFRVLETDTGNPNFSLAEFRVYDVSYFYHDPENN